MDKEKEIDAEVQFQFIMKKFKEARKREVHFRTGSYVYVMIANLDEEYNKNLMKPGFIDNQGIDSRYRTHIKIGRSINPVIRQKELESNLSLKNDHVHPKEVRNLTLLYVTRGETSTEKLMREAVATHWTPLAKTSEYLTYKGHWKSWINDFERFFETDLEMTKHKRIGESDDKILVSSHTQQVLSQGRISVSERNSKSSDPIGISSISVNRSWEYGRSSSVIY
jgi:hypothetical protein